ncbi:MAG: cytochrome c [Bacteroidota bacterium]|nr:cytochrome c [Bacteroidota bacterium]
MRLSIMPLVILLFSLEIGLKGQNSGEEVFKSICSACHTVGKGKLIGPDLAGIYNIRTNEWLHSFIKSSQKMVKSGEPDAVAIYNEFNHIPMPDNNLTDDQINSVINFIRETDLIISETAKAQAQQAPGEIQKPKQSEALLQAAQPPADTLGLHYTSEAVPAGRSLFYGYTGFMNSASPCSGCHNISDVYLLGGGKLAKDLSDSYGRLGPAGINAILTNPPFPVMQRAFRGHELSEEEKTDIISLLKSVSDMPAYNKVPKSTGLYFFAVSFLCAIFILAFIYMAYDNRKIT